MGDHREPEGPDQSMPEFRAVIRKGDVSVVVRGRLALVVVGYLLTVFAVFAAAYWFLATQQA